MKKTPRRLTGLLIALPCALAAAQAQPAVYRCGQTYQQVPCATGAGQAVDAADARTAAQREDARAAASAERQQARTLAAERREREKATAVQTAPMGIAAPSAEDAASAAAGSAAAKKKKKAKKEAEPRYWSGKAG